MFMGKGVFIRGQPGPYPKGAEPQRPPNSWDTYTYTHAVRPKATKFGVVTRVGRSMFLEGQPCPHPKRRAPASLTF